MHEILMLCVDADAANRVVAVDLVLVYVTIDCNKAVGLHAVICGAAGGARPGLAAGPSAAKNHWSGACDHTALVSTYSAIC
jgi:hypothetical protein